MKRRAALLLSSMSLVLGIFVAVPEAAHADLHCSASWHFVTHGQSGATARPDTSDVVPYVKANGNRSADPWNQQVQFCHGDGWTSNHYAIRSNANGKYWTSNPGQGFVTSQATALNEAALFEVNRYDGTWWSIRFVGGADAEGWVKQYVAPAWDGRGYGRLYSTTWPLNGNALWSMSPNNLLG